MNRLKSFIKIGAFSLLVFALPVVASAQWPGGNNGGWSGRNANIRGAIESVKNRASNFDRQVSRVDNRRDNRNDRYDRYDQLDKLASQFKNAANRLANEYGRGRNMNNSRDEAQRLLAVGSQIDQVVFGARGGNAMNVQSDWRQISSDLNTIARAYGLSYTSRNGGWGNRPF